MLDKFISEGLRGKSTTTIKTYKHAILQFERWLEGAGADLLHYGRIDVQQYVDYLTAHQKSAATINKIYNAIKTFSKWSGKNEAIEDIRVVKPENILTKAPKSLDKIERNRLIREIDRSGNKRDYAILMVFMNTGIRLSELVALNKSDVEMSDRKGTLKVRLGKGNKERNIPLNAETRRAITKYLEDRGDNEEALFISNRGKRISQRTVQHIFEQNGIYVHQLRHTFITGLMRAGNDISIIQSMSGHTSADMLMRYSQPTEEDKQKAVENLFID